MWYFMDDSKEMAFSRPTNLLKSRLNSDTVNLQS